MSPLILLATLIASSSCVDLIFDADFGGPIDDTFAVAYAVKKQQVSEAYNLRLISVVGRNTTARATILAKFLDLTGFSPDIAVGADSACGSFFSIGCVGPTWPWFTDNYKRYTLDEYEGKVYYNAVARMTDIISEYSETNPIYIVTVGALTNLAQIISANPDLKKNIRLFTMSGSLFDDTHPWGYFAEFNIVDDIAAAQIVYNDRHIYSYASEICAVPWDTGYYLQIEGDQYQRLIDARNNGNALVTAMLDMYEYWYPNGGYAFDSGRIFHPNNRSASMYDLQMIWLAGYIAELDEDEIDKTCDNIPYFETKAFDVEVNNSGHIWSHDKTMPSVWFATYWKEGGMHNLAKECVDILLYDANTESTDSNSDSNSDNSKSSDHSKSNGDSKHSKHSKHSIDKNSGSKSESESGEQAIHTGGISSGNYKRVVANTNSNKNMYHLITIVITSLFILIGISICCWCYCNKYKHTYYMVNNFDSDVNQEIEEIEQDYNDNQTLTTLAGLVVTGDDEHEGDHCHNNP